MIIYNFRVLYGDPKNKKIYRDIEIKANSKFYDFHKIIQKEFSFNGTELASFFTCDNNWNKKEEITLIEMEVSDEREEPRYIMKETKISEFIGKRNKKLIYIYDFLHYHTFFIELTDIIPKEEKKAIYPRCVKRIGNISFPASRKNSADKYMDKKSLKKTPKSKDSDFKDIEEFNDSEENLDIFDEFKDYENFPDLDDFNNIDDFDR